MSLKLLVILLCIACSGLVAQEKDCEAFKLKRVQAPYEAAICTMVQDEGMYLLEWIEYHRMVGVEHFFLYNDRGTDDSETILKPYIDAGVVTWINWDGNITVDPKRADPDPFYTRYQRYALADCIFERGSLIKYLGVWDIDEFLYFRTDGIKNLGSLVKNYMLPQKYTSLYLPATTFGPSNFNKRPTGLVTENYRWRSSVVAFGAIENKTVGFSGKSLYRIDCANPEVHHTHYPRGKGCQTQPEWPKIVEENGKNVMPEYPAILKHYRSKSYEDFYNKTKKWNIGMHELGTWESFQEKHRKEYEIYDLDMMPYVERIKKAIRCNSKSA